MQIAIASDLALFWPGRVPQESDVEVSEAELSGKLGHGANRTGVSRLRILATSDLHANVAAWDYHADRPSAARGLARTASLIAAARAEVGLSLLLDNGDFLQGSPMGDAAALDHANGQLGPHPMIAAMNCLGYDAATLGNHEFSNGLDFLLTALADARFPVISANVAWSLGPTPLADRHMVPPTLILTRSLADEEGGEHPLRIGLIGLAPPQTTQWDRQQIGGRVQTRDILEAAAAHVPALRAAGAEIVVALSHSGIGDSRPLPMMENATAALATMAGVDVLIAGHTHQRFPSPDFPASEHVDPQRGWLWGKPAVMPGFHGSHLGVIDLDLKRSPSGWQVAGSQAELRPIARRTATGRVRALTSCAPEVLAAVDGAHRSTRLWSRRRVGAIAQELHSYFALVSACPTVRLVAQAQAAHVTRALAGTEYAGLPVLSAAAPFRAGGRGGPDNYTLVPEGPLSMRHVADLYPHPNSISALLISGAEAAEWLERSVSLFRQIAPGSKDAELIDPDFASFNFDTLEGLTYEVDLTQPPRFDARGCRRDASAHRIRQLMLGGQPLDPEARLVIASNSYRSGGTGGFAGARPDRVILSGPESNRDILLAHIEALGAVPATGAANWLFARMPGTTVLFDSAPRAADRLADLAPLHAEALEIAPSGFRRFRLRL